VLILTVLGLFLNAENLRANGNPKELNQNSDGFQVGSPPVDKPASSHEKAARHQSGTKDNPVHVQIISPAKTDAETAQEQKEREDKAAFDRRTATLTEQTVKLTAETTWFNGWLALFAGLQFLVLVGQAYLLYRQSNFNAAQVINQQVIERAYIKISHVPPGVIFMPSGSCRVKMCVKNFGSTPAKVTAEVTKIEVTDMDTAMTSAEEALANVKQRPMEAFLVTDDEFYFVQPLFLDEKTSTVVQHGRKTLRIYSYIDYIDQFGERHRAGYARQFNSALDIEQNYSTLEEYRGRSNLDLLTEPGYNYDRPRKQGEGNDWNNPA
jgi:hypothetical protein